MDQKIKLVIQGGGVYLKKAVRVLIAGAIIAAVAVGFYLIGYKTAYDRIEEVILSRLVDTFISRISLTMLPVPNPHNTVCVLS